MLTLCIYIYISCIRSCRLCFLSCSFSLYHEFCFQVFEGIGFSFYIYITCSTSFILAFGNSLYCVFLVFRRGEYFFLRFWVVSGFNDFSCVEYFFDFVIVSSRFLLLFLLIVLSYFCCRLRRMVGVFHYVFFRFCSSFCGIFSVNSNPLFVNIVEVSSLVSVGCLVRFYGISTFVGY